MLHICLKGTRVERKIVYFLYIIVGNCMIGMDIDSEQTKNNV